MRQDAITSTVLEVTGWTSVPDETVHAIYRWLFGDEALFMLGTEMRLEAGLRMVGNRSPRAVEVPHPDTGEFVLVTHEEILEHADDDHLVLEAAQRHERQLRWHERLIRVLEPCGDDSTAVRDAVRRAASDLGVDAAGRGFDGLTKVVLAASEREGG